ncbi:hypothetical protein EVAR_35879_1 [Eumeta japonica]|uniref:RNase H type-1 domain-containing protein n=1 Tax=Eumeta variegata TaxID=151549 RepID=A0A4C1WWX7_EUMVA|nr:hypothetical protein EVAR_35879_1 [Eumeta japonica]
MDSQTLDRLTVIGPHIYTDGSRIESKAGATFTEWRYGEETWFSTLRLDPFCTVFQAEMIALRRTIQTVKKGKDGLVNVFSDPRSVLEVLTGPVIYHPLAHEARRDISEIVGEGRVVRLFKIRAHVGIADNERADELARRAALTKKTAAGNDKFPLSYGKKRWSGRKEIDASQAERLGRSCLSLYCSVLSLTCSAQAERDNESYFFLLVTSRRETHRIQGLVYLFTLQGSGQAPLWYTTEKITVPKAWFTGSTCLALASSLEYILEVFLFYLWGSSSSQNLFLLWPGAEPAAWRRRGGAVTQQERSLPASRRAVITRD